MEHVADEEDPCTNSKTSQVTSRRQKKELVDKVNKSIGEVKKKNI